jgi:hypothetical protein
MPLDIDIKIDNEAGKAILEDVTLKSFAATPGTIRPFETAVLQWKVEGPEAVSVLLNNKQVSPNGSETVELVATTTFMLSAKALTASKVLGQRTIGVDLDECSEAVISKGIFEHNVQEQVHERIPSSGKVKRRGAAAINYTRANLNIHIPLRVEVPKFFDADTDVTVEYKFTNVFGDEADVRLGDVEVDIDLGTGAVILGTLAGLLFKSGATVLVVEQVVESVLKEFIKGFVARPLEDELEKAIENAARQVCGPKRVRSIFYDDAGIQITCCPEVQENG